MESSAPARGARQTAAPLTSLNTMPDTLSAFSGGPMDASSRIARALQRQGRLVPWLTVCLIGVAMVLLGAHRGDRFESPLGLVSPDTKLVEAFSWAKQQASVYAFEGDAVGPWFEAALPGREAFCMRDASHQAMGAHALGLQPHVRNMLRRFASEIERCARLVQSLGNRPARPPGSRRLPVR